MSNTPFAKTHEAKSGQTPSLMLVVFGSLFWVMDLSPALAVIVFDPAGQNAVSSPSDDNENMPAEKSDDGRTETSHAPVTAETSPEDLSSADDWSITRTHLGPEPFYVKRPTAVRRETVDAADDVTPEETASSENGLSDTPLESSVSPQASGQIEIIVGSVTVRGLRKQFP